jgi:hypothetical protein
MKTKYKGYFLKVRKYQKAGFQYLSKTKRKRKNLIKKKRLKRQAMYVERITGVLWLNIFVVVVVVVEKQY